MFIQPDIDMVNHISSALPQFSTGANLFAGPVRPYTNPSEGPGIPHQATFCLQSGGFNPVTFMVGGKYRKQIVYPTVEIHIRSNPFDFPGAQILANAVLNLLDRRTPDGYIDSKLVTGTPMYLGMDEDGHHNWVVSVDLTYGLQEYPVYFGVGPAASTGTAFIEALATNEYAPFRYRTMTLTSGVGESMYYAFPVDFSTEGAVAFNIVGDASTFSMTSTATVSGITYQLWESTLTNLGAKTVEVT